jgi:site-specific DNA-methyltransferase (adenine-specific)
MQPWENFSQIELAWTSFDKPASLFRFDNRTKDKIHPTQKPVELYAWLLRKFASEGNKILDTHLGSGSSRIAAYKLGFDFVGCEINQRYYEAQEERFRKECLGQITTSKGTYTQQSLFF